MRYRVAYFDGRRDPQTDDPEWFPVRLPSSQPIHYGDRLMAEAVAHALVYTGHVLMARVYRVVPNGDKLVMTVGEGALSAADEADR